MRKVDLFRPKRGKYREAGEKCIIRFMNCISRRIFIGR